MPQDKPRYIVIPQKVSRCRELGAAERQYLCLIHQLEQSGGCYATNQWLAEYFDVTIDSVKKVVKRLRGKGFIDSRCEWLGGRVIVRWLFLGKNGGDLFSPGGDVSSPPEAIDGEQKYPLVGTSCPVDGEQKYPEKVKGKEIKNKTLCENASQEPEPAKTSPPEPQPPVRPLAGTPSAVTMLAEALAARMAKPAAAGPDEERMAMLRRQKLQVLHDEEAA